MPKVCYNKPNRKAIRHFTSKDVARIAKYAVRDGVSATEVLIYVAVAMGFGALICKVARVLSDVMSILSFVDQMAITLSVSAFLERLIYYLTYGKYIPWPPARKAAFALIAVMAFVNGIFAALGRLYSSFSDVKEIADTVSEWCSLVRKAPSELLERVTE